MKAHLHRRYRFSASHRLHNPAFSEEQNRELYGKCNNPFGHGHNYAVTITVSGPIDSSTGMVCNLAELDAFMHREILDRYESANLNALPDFADLIPSTENLCATIFNDVRRGLPQVRLDGVRIDETGNNTFEYPGVPAGKRVQ